MKFRMTRKKNKIFVILGLIFLLPMVASGYALVLSQNDKIGLGGREVYIGFLILAPSALFTFVFLGLLGIMTLWINYLIKPAGNSPQGDYLRNTFSWFIFEDPVKPELGADRNL